MRFAWRGFGAARHRDLSFIRIGAVSIADCGHEFQNALKGYIVRELYPLILADLKDAAQMA